MKITFVHLDLGIGGAERLVVDAGKALKNAGHTVDFVTSHHDRSHCFPETLEELPVTVVGDWLPRSIFGKFYVLCSILRMVVLALYIRFSREESQQPDVIFVDQVSQCIPFLRLLGVPIIFYCHHPDCLLVQRKNALRNFYRKPIDWLEETTTAMADVIVVNSRYTEKVFRETFTNLQRTSLDVIYPTVNFSLFDSPINEGDIEESLREIVENSTTFLSLNRFERKKGISLAIEAFALVKERTSSSVNLIVAGGFDSANIENIEHFNELVECARAHNNLSVTFLKSPSDKVKQYLMKKCAAVIYTPINEHFGIVPIEAMYSRRPVIATDTGGPLETIDHETTGYLCEPNAEAFAKAMLKIVENGEEFRQELGNHGRRRVIEMFSFAAFQLGLCDLIERALEDKSN